MARNNQRLINYHTTGTTMPKGTDVELGEIVVRHNDAQPELIIKKTAGDFATFIDSARTEGLISTAVSSATTGLNATIEAVSGAAKTAIEGLTDSATTLQGEIDSINDSLGLGESATGETIVSRIETLESATGTLNTNLSGLEQSASTSANTLNAKIDAVNTKFTGYMETTAVTAAIATAKSEAIADAKDKDDALFSSATTYVDAEIRELSGVTSAAIDTLRTEINDKIGTAYVYKGTVATKNDLPESGKTEGFVYNVTNAEGTPGDPEYTPAGTNYAWNGEAWDALGGTVDLSNYATTGTVNGVSERVTAAEGEIDALQTATTALQTAVETANDDIDALSAATGTLSSNLTALDGRVGTLSGRVDTIEADYVKSATTDALDGRIDKLEAISGQSHTHANKTELDKFADGDKAKLDTAVQTVVVSNTDTNKITATKQGTEVTFDFSNMVIDCGSY